MGCGVVERHLEMAQPTKKRTLWVYLMGKSFWRKCFALVHCATTNAQKCTLLVVEASIKLWTFKTFQPFCESFCVLPSLWCSFLLTIFIWVAPTSTTTTIATSECGCKHFTAFKNTFLEKCQLRQKNCNNVKQNFNTCVWGESLSVRPGG